MGILKRPNKRLGKRFQEKILAVVDELHGISSFQLGEPLTPDNDPLRPSSLRCFLEPALPKHMIEHRSLLNREVKNVEDPYQITASHQVIDAYQKVLYGFFYQDITRTYHCRAGGGRGLFFIPFYHPYSCTLLEQINRGWDSCDLH